MLFRFWKRLSKQDGRSSPGTSVKVTPCFMLSLTKMLFPNGVTCGCRVEECSSTKHAAVFSAPLALTGRFKPGWILHCSSCFLQKQGKHKAPPLSFVKSQDLVSVPPALVYKCWSPSRALSFHGTQSVKLLWWGEGDNPIYLSVLQGTQGHVTAVDHLRAYTSLGRCPQGDIKICRFSSNETLWSE